MEFINNTLFHTLIHRTALENDQIAMSIMCRITYDVEEDGKAIISGTQDWELHQDFWESEYGPMDKDDVFKRGGIDIMLFGSAKAPRGKSVTESDVIIDINDKIVHRVKIFGDRVWQSFLGSLSISAPEAFTEIPLNVYNAFGGHSEWDGIQIPYPANPYGKGYYHKKKEAIGKPLPNVEHYDNPIKKWNSWQEPAGVASLSILPLKAKNNVVLNQAKTNIERLDAKFFNSAFPQLIIDEIKHGDIISVEGMTDGKAFSFQTPNTNLELAIILGEKKITKKMQIDQIGLIPDQKKAFVSYRFPFKYVIKPMEKRRATLDLLS